VIFTVIGFVNIALRKLIRAISASSLSKDKIDREELILELSSTGQILNRLLPFIRTSLKF